MNYVIDMGGVLMDHNIPGCIARFKELLGENFENLGLGGNGEGTKLMGQYERGEISEDEFIGYIQNIARPLTSRQDIIDAWNLIHAGIPEQRIAKLRQMKAEGHRLYLLSNVNETHWKDVTAHYDIDAIFDRTFLSCREHCSKPDPRIFESVMRQTGLKGQEIVFIDDLEANREAARNFGWRTFASLEEIPNGTK